MLTFFSIVMMMFIGLGILYSRRNNRSGSVMFMFVIAGIMQAFMLYEVLTIMSTTNIDPLGDLVAVEIHKGN